jgi:nitroreductase
MPLVVFQARKKVDAAFIQSYIELIAQTRGIPTTALNDYRGMMLGSVGKAPESLETQEWCKRQAYLAMGFLLLTAAQLGVDACPMEGVEGSQYDALLEGASSAAFQTVAVAALGYRSSADATQKYLKVRLPKESFFTFR